MISDRKIFANVIDPEETRVAVVEGGRLNEVFVERMWDRQRSGDIYKARVDSVLPGMNAAFLNLGEGRNAFLYLEDARGSVVKQNTDLLVQVTKTARKGKGARVTTRLSLPGRFLVLVPGGGETGVSRRPPSTRLRFWRGNRASSGVHRPTTGVTFLKGPGNGGVTCLPAHTTPFRQDLTDSILWTLHQALLKRLFGNFFYYSTFPCWMEGSLQGACLFELGHRRTESALDRKVWLESGAYLVMEQTSDVT